MVRFPCQLSDPFHLTVSQISNHTVVAIEKSVDLVESLVTIQRPGWWVITRFEFVEPPPQPVLGCGSVSDQGFPIINQ